MLGLLVFLALVVITAFSLNFWFGALVLFVLGAIARTAWQEAHPPYPRPPRIERPPYPPITFWWCVQWALIYGAVVLAGIGLITLLDPPK
jgi:hypothetical protein